MKEESANIPSHSSQSPFPTPGMRGLGFLRATGLSYLAGGSVWAIVGLFFSLAEGDPDSAITATVIGFVYAGGVHLVASGVPSAFLWALLTPDSSLTRLGPALFVGFAMGTIAGLFSGPLAPLFGLLYGMPTAAIHLFVYRRLEAIHRASLPAHHLRTASLTP